ncbi:MAG: glycine cleavage system aminomethyltransferase GcvT [Tissierellia bacterium]|nr:glycine cleavage system aminomethyltransferase GcvT [Tissierellia bacterium]
MVAKKTPLYDEHVKLGGKIVDYAGWFLPVQYEGLIPEHEAVRNAAGIFDVSHMGVVMVKGKDALPYLQYLFTNDLSKAEVNQVMYTMMCYPDGGVVDDLLAYKFSDDEYLLVINAANTDKDIKWMIDNKKDFNIIIENISDQTSIMAVQGPSAEKILQQLTDFDLSSLKPNTFERNVTFAGKECLISRTGYTGEDGFEVYAKAEDTVEIWNKILEAGKEYGLKPAGLGARDTLRFEASMPLYGNEISEDINPLEAGLKFFVKLDKAEDFIGKEALNKQWNEGLKRKLVGFELLGRGIPRDGYEVQKDGKKIGHVTTGYMSPTLKKSIGNALIDIKEAELGNEIDIMIRNKPVKAKIIDRRFLRNR